MAVRSSHIPSSSKSSPRIGRDPSNLNGYPSLTIPEPGIRLLAFDDGGVRGLAMLLLLRDVLRQYQQAVGLHTLPRPCDCFDIIAGSGTGGFIALMLGRLRLSIENAIECYARVVEHVFAQTKAGGNFKATPFEKVLREISRRFGEGEETPVLDPYPMPCKTFVCTREEDESGRTTSQKLRTYSRPDQPAIRCTLVEAVRATMGNPTFFKPLSVVKENGTVSFLDAGDDHCNPVFDLYEEARFFYPSRDVAYNLSLGPGTVDTIGENPPRRFVSLPRLPPATLSALRHLADRCDRIAADFNTAYGDSEGKYCRLTPSHPPHAAKIRWEQEEALQELTLPYITAMSDQVSAFVLAMMNETAARHGSAR
ncbi:acyl transferase/acyl hydrolase/lysophospholipase [Schizophyllum fasciatum]